MLSILSTALALALLGAQADESSTAAARQYQSLIRELEAGLRAYVEEARKDSPDRAKLDAFSKARDPRRYVARFGELARQNPDDPAAVDALVWISNSGTRPECDDAREILARRYITSARIGPVFQGLEHESGSPEAERLFRAAVAKNPRRDVRGRACYWLARYLAEQAWYSRALQRPAGYWKGRTDVDIEPPKHIESTYGKEAVDRLARSNPSLVMEEVEALYRRVATDYPDIENDSRWGGRRKTLGEAAQVELDALKNLAIGQPAPEILGEDVDGKPFRLSDYRGKVVVLDFGSHTYCGSCRDLIPQWQSLARRLETHPFALIGLNTDPDRTKLKAALNQSGVTWRTVWDGDLGGPIFSAWDVRSWPTIFVIDRQGVIRHKDVFGKELDQAIDALVREPGAK